MKQYALWNVRGTFVWGVDLRDLIRAEIATIEAFDVVEEDHLKNSLDWIDTGVEIFRHAKPATPPRHLVSYFLLVDGDWVLLVDHINAQLWLPTGGHVDPGEHPRTTVSREVKEELGIEADFKFSCPIFLTVSETVGKTAGHTDVSLWYVLNGNRDQPLVYDTSEFTQIKWFRRSEVPLDRADPNLGRFLSKLDLVIS